jgi:hypothetical protein
MKCRSSGAVEMAEEAHHAYDKMLQFAAVDTVELLAPTPILIIAGDKAETLDQSKAAFERANEPKELFQEPRRAPKHDSQHTGKAAP